MLGNKNGWCHITITAQLTPTIQLNFGINLKTDLQYMMRNVGLLPFNGDINALIVDLRWVSNIW